MPTDRSRTWDGGYIRTDSKGREVYYIRKRVEGKLYDLSTRATSSAAANEQWRRFQANPEEYRPGGGLSGDLGLAPDTVRAFLEWSRDVKRNTPKWVRDQLRALEWWAEQLGAVDLRQVRTQDLADALDGTAARKQKIATLKTFCSWLIHERHRMEAKDDPTAGLFVPQARPEQWTNPKTFTQAQFRAARRHLEQPWRDAADVLAGTGWHSTELERFARGVGDRRGRVAPHPLKKGAVVLMCPQTKGGEPHSTEVSAAVARAGRRLLGAEFDYYSFNRALRAACKAAGMKASTIQPGTFRHSVATWAVNSGAHPAAVTAFLGHKSPQTTRRFYATHAVPAKVPTLT
jgi:integrase